MSNNLIPLPNVLLIAGNGQNVGKTTFSSRVISHFSRENKISAIKVTPHFHKSIGQVDLIKEEESFQIHKENSTDTNKDSSRMLKAGAENAYLLQTKPEGQLKGFLEIIKLIPANHLIVCESAKIRDYVKPGAFLMFRQLSCKNCSIDDEKWFNLADRIVMFSINGFDFSPSELKIEGGKWMLNKSQT